jgi:hypothetical protein
MDLSAFEDPQTSSEWPDLVPAPDLDDAWVRSMVPVVERAIDELVDRYIRHPFLHRVEHSLHTELYQLLVSHPDLGQLWPIGRTGYRTRLVHKEWPETYPRPAKGNRRGNFDIALLTPDQLGRVTRLEQFTQGSIAAAIVVELGLGYGEIHLHGDSDKLKNSRVQHPYLVHFSHVRSRRHPESEAAVMAVASPLQVAYVRHDLDHGVLRLKRRADAVLTELADETRRQR